MVATYRLWVTVAVLASEHTRSGGSGSDGFSDCRLREWPSGRVGRALVCPCRLGTGDSLGVWEPGHWIKRWSVAGQPLKIQGGLGVGQKLETEGESERKDGEQYCITKCCLQRAKQR